MHHQRDVPSVRERVRRKNKPKMSNVCLLITQEAYQAVTFRLSVLVVFNVYTVLNTGHLSTISRDGRRLHPTACKRRRDILLFDVLFKSHDIF